MFDVEYLTIAEFADRAGVSKQAIYKQVNNENSQIAPFLLRDGKKTYIKVSALSELYKVDTLGLTQTEEKQPFSTKQEQVEVEKTTEQTTQSNPKKQPDNPNSTQFNQPISTDYIEFLKKQIEELKADRDAVEQRLSATIQEKDNIIKEQSAQLSSLAQQVAQIADKALIATSQQQYLTAMEKGERADTVAIETQQVEEEKPEKRRKGFLWWLFGNQGIEIIIDFDIIKSSNTQIIHREDCF